MIETVLHLGTPTPGDENYYDRWNVFGRVLTDAELPPAADATVLVVDQHVSVCDPDKLLLPKLKYVCSATTGHTHLKWAQERGLRIISLRGEKEFLKNVRSVSEFTIKALLEISRPKDGVGHLLNGKSIGIIGMGRIGKHVTVLAHAFGMKVYGVDKGSAPWAWDAAMGADFVSVHAVEDETTKGLVSREMLAKMKPHAWLINTARASIVDEKALKELLTARKIAGAYLDVTNESWHGPINVVLTGHTAGYTLEDRIKTDEFIVEKLKKAIGYKRMVREAPLFR